MVLLLTIFICGFQDIKGLYAEYSVQPAKSSIPSNIKMNGFVIDNIDLQIHPLRR